MGEKFLHPVSSYLSYKEPLKKPRDNKFQTAWVQIMLGRGESNSMCLHLEISPWRESE